jgi:Kef-type K+ transport system membrane component KefB
MAFLPAPAEPIGVFLALLLVMMGAPLLEARLRLPAALIIMGLGVLAGPAGLDLLGMTEGLRYVGAIGAAYALSQAGMELEIGQFRRSRDRSLVLGLLAAFVATAAGFLLGSILLGLEALPSLALGLVMAAGSSPRSPAGGGARPHAAVAATAGALAGSLLASLGLVADHVAAALAPSLPGAGGLLRLGGEAAALLGLVLLAFFLVPRAAALFFKLAKPDGPLEFAFVTGLALLCAFAAALIGIDPIAGAFLGGLLLGRFIPESSPLVARLRFVGDQILVPFLYLAAGLFFSPAILASAEGLVPAAFILAALLLSRGLVALLAMPLAGLDGGEARSYFGLSLARPAVPLAFAVAALSAGFLRLDAASFSALFLAQAGASFIGSLLSGSRDWGSQPHAGRHQEYLSSTDRVMLAVSNPATMKGLMELAFLFRRRGSAEPVRPVAVVADADASEEELARVESTLARAMVMGEQAKIPVRPAARTCLNVPEGVLEAALDYGVGTIIVGWNRAPRLSKTFFGSVIERLVRDARELVIVSRPGGKAEGAATARGCDRLAIIVPPLADRHPGFPAGVEALANLAARSGAALTFFVQKPLGSGLRDELHAIRGRGASRYVELETWQEAPRAIAQAQPAQDTVALLCARPGGPAWHPSAERLPSMLEQELPGTGFLLLYLPGSGEAEAGAEEQPRRRDLLAQSLEGGRILTAMRDTAIADGVRTLLASRFGGDRKALGRLAALFTEIAQKQPIELEPGVLLLHAHVPEVEEPLVFLGAKTAGFRLLALPDPVRVLVILCAPEGQPPEAHLAVLGEIAALFKDRALAERLIAAETPEDLRPQAPDERR